MEKTSLNLLFISGPLDPSIGGVQRVTWSLSQYFEKKGYNCFFIYCGEDTPLIDNRHKLHLDYQSEKHTAFYEHFRDFVKNNDISIIIDQDYSSDAIIYSLIEIKKEFNIRLIFCFHRNPYYWDFMSNNKPHKIIIKNAIKKILRRPVYYPGFTQLETLCDKYVVLSKSYIRQFSYRYNISPKCITAIVNPTPFCESVDLHWRQKKKIVLIVTRFVEIIKNIKSALNVWKTIEPTGYNKWELIIAGYGEDEEEIKRYAKEIELKSYFFVGKLDDPVPYYKKSSILMMTSNCEGYPMTLIEAMQFGCVPIAFNNYASLKDIITNNKNGIIVPSKNINSFSKKLLYLMSNRDFREKLALNAIESSENNTIDRVGASWLELLKGE